MRRPWLLGPLFLVLCTTVASGDVAPNVANTSQKGSVHVFPYVVADANRTTFIRLANEGPGDIDVHCEFRDDKDVRGGFVTTIKKRQATWVDVSEGGIATYNMASAQYPQHEGGITSVGEGLLVCWAVDEGDANQIRWNHIFGTATLVDYTNGTLFEYPSWAFQARTGADKSPVGVPGTILLDGLKYDACPGSLHGVTGDNPDSPPGPPPPPPPPPPPGPPTIVDPVIVTPCVFDVRQDRDPFTTRLRVRTWTAAGVGPSTANTCIDFWHRVILPSATGSFQLDALADGICTGAQAVGLVGVHYRPGDTARGGTGLAGSNMKNGVIYWDPSSPPE